MLPPDVPGLLGAPEESREPEVPPVPDVPPEPPALQLGSELEEP